MQKAGILFRFIDLGLVLLMAFLAVADIRADVQVQLPGGEQADTGQAVLYRLDFDLAMQAQLKELPGEEVLCNANELDALGTCMQAADRAVVGKTGQQARFVLAPEEGVILQQLVLLLDLCEAEGLACTVES